MLHLFLLMLRHRILVLFDKLPLNHLFEVDQMSASISSMKSSKPLRMAARMPLTFQVTMRTGLPHCERSLTFSTSSILWILLVPYGVSKTETRTTIPISSAATYGSACTVKKKAHWTNESTSA